MFSLSSQLRSCNASRLRRGLIVAAAVCIAAATATWGESTLRERYEAAIARANQGQLDEALEELGSLAETVPASVPVHRAIALTALAAGEEAAADWSEQFRQRLRRSRRDVGASVGRAILLADQGRDREAHSLLTSAIFAGARHPLLLPVLLETSPDPEGLSHWARRRARALGDDPDFEALRIRLLMQLGKSQEALEVVESTLEDHPQMGDLLALHATLSWAAGDERTACEEAALAIGFLDDGNEVAGLRVPRRAHLARALISCGRHGDAQTVLGGLGALVTPPGADPLEPLARAVSAELSLAQGRLVEAIAMARREGPEPAPAPWDETLRSIAVRARARAGLAVNARELLAEAPADHPLALVDRSLALAAVAASPQPPRGLPLTPQPFERLSRELLDHGFDVRGVRAGLLAELIREAEKEGRRDLDDLLAIVGPGSAASAVRLQTATRIVRVQSAFEAGDGDAVLSLTEVPAVERAGAPGALLAPIRVARARAELAAGHPAAALEAVEEGLLDLQSADLEQSPLPAELQAFETAFGTPALVLPGLAFRAALERGDAPGAAAARLLEAMDRAARTWSILGLPGAREPLALTERLPEGGCLIVAPPDLEHPKRGGLVARMTSAGTVAVGTPAELLSQPPCAGADIVYWLGPGGATGGLRAGHGAEGLLVRWIGPRPLPGEPDGETARPSSSEPGHLGPGAERPFRTLVESLAGVEGSDDDGDPVVASQVRLYGWPIHTGAGLALSATPLASGWLVPPTGNSELGWMTPEDLPPAPSTGSEPAPGLVSLRLSTAADSAGSERGAWLLAEAGIDAGWAWALLSRRPLSDGEIARLEETWDDWRDDPLAAAADLVEKHPELADALTLWTAPGRLHRDPSIWSWVLAVALGVALVVAVLVLRPWRQLSRRGRAGRGRPAPRDRSARPS
jgi:tetratricopeptide (TPR) repeat protein